MGRHVFVDVGGLAGAADRLLQAAFVHVVAANGVAAGVDREPFGGEDILPAPLGGGMGIFAAQGVGQIDCAMTLGQVLVVQPFNLV